MIPAANAVATQSVGACAHQGRAYAGGADAPRTDSPVEGFLCKAGEAAPMPLLQLSFLPATEPGLFARHCTFNMRAPRRAPPALCWALNAGCAGSALIVNSPALAECG